MSETIELMLKHSSVRDFAPKADIDEATLREIIDAGRAASTWRALQSYSIIVVRDHGLKYLFSNMIHQPAINDCSVFLVFVGDLARAKTAVEMNVEQLEPPASKDSHTPDDDLYDDDEAPEFQPGLVESLLVTSVDASLCAQNVLLAAESLGLGGCFIGMVRTKSAQISDLLGLAEYQYPLFGMVLGVPASRIPVKPRLPYDSVVFLNHYHDSDAARRAAILQHEADLVDFPDPRPMTFSERQTDQWGKPGQTSSTDNLRNHGFSV